MADAKKKPVEVESTRVDPGGMKKAFDTPVPSTKVDEDQPKDTFAERISRGIKVMKKKVGN